MEPLIFDRTQQDTVFAFNNQHLTDLKGAYNASDLNRVGEWCHYLANEFKRHGYNINIDLKTDWNDTDKPTVSDYENYIKNLKIIRGMFQTDIFPNIPNSITELYGFQGWEKANVIEYIISFVDFLINGMIAAFRHSGTFNSGMEGLRV